MQSPTQSIRAAEQHFARAIIAAAIVVVLGCSIDASAQEVAAGKFAATIRASGYPCARVIESKSKGDSVWHVRCNAGWYEVTKKGDSQAKVVPLD